MTTQQGCGTRAEFEPDVRLGVGFSKPGVGFGHGGGAQPEPPRPRYFSISRNPFVVAYVFTGGCTWTKARPIPKVPDTSP
jgi:hypothetical protein